MTSKIVRCCFVVLAGFVFTGCSIGSTTTVSTPTPTPILSGENTEIRKGVAGDQIVGNYRVFDKGLYEKAKNDEKVILLYFYANWDPGSQVQEPVVVNAFRELSTNEEIVGFRVNIADTDTTPDGKEVAREYGIVNQNTFVVLGQDKQTKNQFTGSWLKDDIKVFLEKGGNK